MNSFLAGVKQRISPIYRYLLLATALATYLLIAIGIAVRVTHQTVRFYEWHRLTAGILGLLLLTVTGLAWQRHRSDKVITGSLSLATGLLGIQALMGGLLAGRVSAPIGSAVHLGFALVIQTLVMLPVVIVFTRSPGEFHFKMLSPFARLSGWTIGVTFLLLISGSVVSASGAGSTCVVWPLCSGALVPTGILGWINTLHRFISGVAGILMLALLFQAWRTQRSRTAILVATTTTGVLFFAQVLMGLFETQRGYPAYLLGLHTATAAAVWAALVIQFTLTGMAEGSTEVERLEVAARRDPGRLLKDLLVLTKPIVVALLLVTTYAGMVIGAKAWPSLDLTFWVLLGGFMAAGGSGAINQYIDRFDDMKMQRTWERPIPAGRLTPGEGLAFGVAMTLASFYIMVAFVNFLAALLVLAGIIYYVLLYSIILKKATVQNIVIGGGAGAIPPLVGWAAATGHLNVPALFLFAIVFMWTPPHFWALALVRRKDYARAGVPMLPVVRGERETRWQIFLYTIELVALTLVLPLFGLGGGIYLVSATMLGAWLIHAAWKVWHGEGNKVAWTMYRYSSMYLAFLFLALMVDALL
jgi:protoheme IX farnesyltransferase